MSAATRTAAPRSDARSQASSPKGRAPAAPSPANPVWSGLAIQRKCAACEDEETLQTKRTAGTLRHRAAA
jgi:hypothetical protein